ncbi:unnamed protein product, partial [Brachionus calyciflorus]
QLNQKDEKISILESSGQGYQACEEENLVLKDEIKKFQYIINQQNELINIADTKLRENELQFQSYIEQFRNDTLLNGERIFNDERLNWFNEREKLISEKKNLEEEIKKIIRNYEMLLETKDNKFRFQNNNLRSASFLTTSSYDERCSVKDPLCSQEAEIERLESELQKLKSFVFNSKNELK